MKRGGLYGRAPLLLTFSAQIGAKLVRALPGKSGQVIARNNWSKRILHAWPANDERVEDQEGVFVLVIVL